MRAFIHHLLLVLGAAALLTGCLVAEERDPINRVQANAVSKAFFVGEDLASTEDDPEFYAQNTLLGVSYGASQFGLFTNYSNNMARIKWHIEEDILLARATYERIEGADGFGVGPTDNDGQVLAAFRIESHFDIKRAYNPSTGEELNVIEENRADRPWYEREYMRVDWSSNLATSAYDFDTLGQLGLFGGITYEPMGYDVTDPNHPHAPLFDTENGYFDVSVKAFASPGLIDLSGLGWGIDSFPACFLPPEFAGGTDPVGNCNPVEVTVRHSFKKVTDTDYEIFEYDGFRFQAFGAFLSERKGYSRRFGMVDQEWHRFVNRYNFWERSHYYDDPEAMTGEVACFTPDTTPEGADPHRDEDGDGTEDECAAVTTATGVGGSRCDTFAQKCTLPWRARTVKVLPFHYTEDGNMDFYDTSEEAVHQWDVAIRHSIQVARYAECVDTGGSRADCEAAYPVIRGQQNHIDDMIALATEVDHCRHGKAYDGQDCAAVADTVASARGYVPAVTALAKQGEVVVLCHSPVLDADHPACGEPGTVARLGDMRFHHVTVVDHAESPSPWGYGPTSADPLTGEVVSGRANVWSHVNDIVSQIVIDKLRFIAGELSAADIVGEGQYVRDWVSADNNGVLGPPKARHGGVVPGLSRKALDKKMAAFAKLPVEEFKEKRDWLMEQPDLLEQLGEVEQKVRGVHAHHGAHGHMDPIYEHRRMKALGSELEAQLTTVMMQALTDTEGLTNPNDVLLMSSPLRGNNPRLLRKLREAREMKLAEQGACIYYAPSPTAMTGLADKLAGKFGAFNADDPIDVQLQRAEKMRKYLAERFHGSVMLHELGHTFGLRHNFVSSYDAWNYRPQYWQLRTRNGAVTNACNDLTDDGNSCVGPRFFDPITDEEEDGLLQMWAQTTTMEYAGEMTQDMLNMGVWDLGATRMFYTDVAAVYDDSAFNVSTGRGQAVLAKQDNFGGILGMSYTADGNQNGAGIHYTQLQGNFSLISNCKAVNADDYKPAVWPDHYGQWDPTLDGHLVQVNGSYSRCDTIGVDYVPWRRMDSSNAGGGASPQITSRARNQFDAAGRPRVPYGFGTDSWADLGNLSVYRHDAGADPYELFTFFITEQEVNHIFDNYRRDRTSFSVRSAASRTLSRYNEKMRDAAKGLGLFANFFREISLQAGIDFNSLWPLYAGQFLRDNILASGMAFDHFARIMARPQSGPHYLEEFAVEALSGNPNVSVLRSADAALSGNLPASVFNVPNGVQGFWDVIGIGGRPINNQLSDTQGEWDSQFTTSAGSYYEKAYTTLLMTESVDNFISQSPQDFTDGRYRSVSMADLFPEGYRRWLAANLTGDITQKGAFAYAPGGELAVDGDDFPTTPIGWTTWWGDEPEVCFPAAGSALCSSFGANLDFGDLNLTDVVAIDPQVGWEQQKFLIGWTLMYLPENQQQWWLDRIAVWELGGDADPGFDNRIELHDPFGRVFIAKTFGKETIFGQEVEKGIGARVLAWANKLLDAAYETTPVDHDGDGSPDWFLPQFNDDGTPKIKYDPGVGPAVGFAPPATCNAVDNSGCQCESNRACVQLQRYMSVPTFIRQAIVDTGLHTKIKGFF
jgi:hypothetical protein